jgi:hypothetical protein
MRRLAWSIVLAPAVAVAGDAVPPEVPDVLGVTATATSTLAAKGKAFDPWFALGGDPTKFWCEGKSDEGVGEALVLKLSAPTKIESLVLRAGVWRSPELFAANNRITELDVVTDDGRVKKVKLNDRREDVDVSLGRAPVTELRLEIAAVAKGKLDDTCISGVELHTSPPTSIVLGADAAAAAALAPAFAKVWHAFGACDEKALGAQLQFPFSYGETGRAKHYANAKAVRKACKDGAFSSFQPATASLHLRSTAPGKVVVATDTLEWRFALAAGAWKLTNLVDDTH